MHTGSKDFKDVKCSKESRARSFLHVTHTNTDVNNVKSNCHYLIIIQICVRCAADHICKYTIVSIITKSESSALTKE